MSKKNSASCAEIDVHLGHKITLARALRGMTHNELSLKIGVTPLEMIEFEDGTKRIGSRRLFKIAEILNINNQWLFEGFTGEINLPDFHSPQDSRLLH